MKLPKNMHPKKTDTPRTDAAHDPTSPEILYFEAKKMEKELAAAQEHAERLREALEVYKRTLEGSRKAVSKGSAPYDLEFFNAIVGPSIDSALAAPSGQRFVRREVLASLLWACSNSASEPTDLAQAIIAAESELARTAPETIAQEGGENTEDSSR